MGRPTLNVGAPVVASRVKTPGRRSALSYFLSLGHHSCWWVLYGCHCRSSPHWYSFWLPTWTKDWWLSRNSLGLWCRTGTVVAYNLLQSERLLYFSSLKLLRGPAGQSLQPTLAWQLSLSWVTTWMPYPLLSPLPTEGALFSTWPYLETVSRLRCLTYLQCEPGHNPCWSFSFAAHMVIRHCSRNIMIAPCFYRWQLRLVLGTSW